MCRRILILWFTALRHAACPTCSNSILNHQLSGYGGGLAISVMGVLYAMFMMMAMPIFGMDGDDQPDLSVTISGAEHFDRVKKTLELAVLAATSMADAGFRRDDVLSGQVIGLFNGQGPGHVGLGSTMRFGSRP